MDVEPLEDWLPNACNLLALGDGVGGDKGAACLFVLGDLSRLEIPVGNIVDFSCGLVGLSVFVAIRKESVLLLPWRLQTIPHEGRVPDDVVVLDGNCLRCLQVLNILELNLLCDDIHLAIFCRRLRKYERTS